MAKGYWLTRGQAIFATQKTPYQFDRLAHSLNRRGKNSHTKQFFVPEWQVTDQYKSKNIPCQEQVGNDVLDQLVANVSFTEQTEQDNSLNDQYKRVKIEETKVRTKLQNQKLEERKKLLFRDWSERFFDKFASNFGFLRNCLVNMRLNEDQVKIFNETLDHCIDNLQLSLDQIWEDFSNEKEQDE